MASKSNVKRVSFVIGLIIVILMIFYVGTILLRINAPYNHFSVAANYNESKHYLIKPDTILEEVSLGKSDVFSPLVDNQMLDDQSDKNYIWTQSDFFSVASVLDRYAWHNTQEKWLVSNILFRGNCTSPDLGFDTFSVWYFYLVDTREYKPRKVGIFLQINEVEAGEHTASPIPLFGIEGFYINDLEVAADEALRIADENGGIRTRLQIENKCNIFAAINSIKEGWQIIYYSNESLAKIFEASVDAITGDVSVLTQ